MPRAIPQEEELGRFIIFAVLLSSLFLLARPSSGVRAEPPPDEVETVVVPDAEPSGAGPADASLTEAGPAMADPDEAILDEATLD